MSLTKFAVAAIAVTSFCCAQVVTTIAGNGVGAYSGDGGPATAASVNSPQGVAVDSNGNLYIAEFSTGVIRRVDPSGTITTVAGCGQLTTACILAGQGDGGPATAPFLGGPWDVVVDRAGNFYFSDSGTNSIRKVDTNGILTTFAGNGTAGFSGDGGPASQAQLNDPIGLAIDNSGNLYIADGENNRIRKVDTAGTITTVAGNGVEGFSGDGGAATSAALSNPHGVGVDANGNIYIADTNNFRVRKVNGSGNISTVAGNGDVSPSTDGVAATATGLTSPWDVKVDAAGNIYTSEAFGYRVRKVDPSGIITTVAGTGVSGYSGDGGPATAAQFSTPAGLALDDAGNLYVADPLNNRVRKVTAAPAAPAVPVIRSANPVISSFLGNTGFSSNTYIEIYGSGLSSTSRLWSTTDFNGSNAPVSLDGVSVTVNGKPAFIYYVSPGQINVNTPDDTATGPVAIQVKTAQGLSNTVMANRSRISPTLQSVPQFNIGGKQYVVALTPDFKSYIGQPNMIPGVSFVAAKPGDTVSIYALGCGPTNPPTQAGVVAAQASPLSLSYQIKIGGIPANVSFAGIVAGSIGLYQFNVTIPQVPAGDQSIELTVDGVSNAQNLYIAIGG